MFPGGCCLNVWLFTSLSFQCHLSIIVNTTQQPARHLSANNVKRPAGSKRLLELPINASPSTQITTPGVWECVGQHAGTRRPPELSQQLSTTPCLSFLFSISHLLLSPPCALPRRLYLYIMFHLLRGNGHSSHQLAGPAAPRHSDVQTERPAVRQWGT